MPDPPTPWRKRRRRTSAAGLLLPGHLGPQALLGGPDFVRRVHRGEVLRLVHLAEFHVGAAVERGALEPLDRLLLRRHLPEPETCDQLLRLRERAVGHGPLAAVERHPRPPGAGVQALAGEHHPGLDELLVVLVHRLEDLRARKHAGLRLRAALDAPDEPHVSPLSGVRWEYGYPDNPRTHPAVGSPSGSRTSLASTVLFPESPRLVGSRSGRLQIDRGAKSLLRQVPEAVLEEAAFRLL